MSGSPTAAIRSHAPNRPPAASDAEVCSASSRMSAPAANARVPGAGDDDRPAGRIGVERLERRREVVEQVEAEGVERLGPVQDDAARRRAGSSPAAADRGAGAGNVTRTTPGDPSVQTVPAAGRPGRRSRGVHLGDVLHHEEGRQPGRDLAKNPAGGAHRIRRQAGVEGRAVVEPHRRHQDEVRLAPERARDPLDPGLAQAGRPGDQRQVFGGVPVLERRLRLRTALGAPVQDQQGRHGDTSDAAAAREARASATDSVDR